MKYLSFGILPCLILCLTMIAGCGESYVDYKAESPRSAQARSIATDNESLYESESATSGSDETGGEDASKSEDADNNADSSPPAKITRKIIYNADVRLVVKDFDPVEKEIRSLVEKHSGFVASSDVGAERGEYRYGNWTTRIPVENYSSFLNDIASLGSVTSRTENAEDVTEEFVDLSARISNKQKLEARIIELLENRDDKIKDVIEVERELGRVREEIERMQGRLRYLSDRSSLATVSIYAVEQRDFKPAEAMSFGERISATWSDSLGRLLAFGKNLLIFLVAIAPWAIVALLGLIPFYLLLRRAFWRSRVTEG